MIDGIIKKQKADAELARKVFDENTELEAKIQKGLKRLTRKISEAKKIVLMCEGNVIGTWTEILAYDAPEDQIAGIEAEIDAHQRFLKRAPAIRDELERQTAECYKQIKNAEIVGDQLERLKEYQDLKSRLLETYSDQELFHLAVLEQQIASFVPGFFEKDFIKFFNKLKTRNHGESRLLAIPVPDTEGASAVVMFWKRWRYEFLRHDLLSRAWNRDGQRGENLVREMRALANALNRHVPLVKDFSESFLPKLQDQNKGFRILELR